MSKLKIAAALLLLSAGCLSTVDEPSTRSSVPTEAQKVWWISSGNGGGTGVPVLSVLMPNGGWKVYFLTARHVAENLDPNALVASQESGWMILGGKIEGLHPTEDAAVMSFESRFSVPTIKIRTSPVEFGEQLFGAGYGAGQGQLWLTQGLACSPSRSTTPVCPGDSGGAVLDQNGELVGLLQSFEILGVGGREFLVMHHCDFVPLPKIREWVLKITG